MADELQLPREGMSTIGAQFTKSAVSKVLQAVKKLKDQGFNELAILDKMKKELPFFHPHTVRRLYDKSVGNPIEDDFREADVVSEKELKPGTIELALKAAAPGIERDCLIQFRGGDWYVAKVTGATYLLKKI
jgi:hypothetical protein